nr:hypothetical protein [Streptomyces sulphureus]
MPSRGDPSAQGGDGEEHDARSEDERGPDAAASLAPCAGGPRRRRGLANRRRRASAAAHEGAAGAPTPAWRGRIAAFSGAVADRIMDTAPRIPVRDAETLRAQFPGLGTEEIADRLVSGAVKGSAAVGAGVGAAAMLPVPPAMPAELAAELAGVASVELKLVAELHEIYGRPALGNPAQRARVYLVAWTEQRGIDPFRPGTLSAASGGLSSGLRSRLRKEIARRTLRNLPNLAPMLAGAALGAAFNRRETARLAGRVRGDLRDGGR